MDEEADVRMRDSPHLLLNTQEGSGGQVVAMREVLRREGRGEEACRASTCGVGSFAEGKGLMGLLEEILASLDKKDVTQVAEGIHVMKAQSPAGGFLFAPEVEAEEPKEQKSAEQWFEAVRQRELRQALEIADRVLIEGVPAEWAAYQGPDLAVAILQGEVKHYAMLNEEKVDTEPWVYRWDHGDSL
jgi:hypothetical protein